MQTRRGKGLGTESEEKREPVSDIDTGALDSLKVLDPDGRSGAAQGIAFRNSGQGLRATGATGPVRGVAWFTHDDPDRPPGLFAGMNTLHTGGQYQSYLLLPMLPMR
jgi:hypothetical protein